MSATTVAAETTSQQTQAERLFQPFQLGPYNFRHRMLMAPLTRSRSRQPGNIPSAMNA
jgi:N-ethylmaleimide reductase